MRTHLIHIRKTGGRTIINSILNSLVGSEGKVPMETVLRKNISDVDFRNTDSKIICANELGVDNIKNIYGELTSNLYESVPEKIKGKYLCLHCEDVHIEDDKFFSASHSLHHKLFFKDNTLGVTVLRDPLERVMSQYRMILGMKKLGLITSGLDDTSYVQSLDYFIDNYPPEHLSEQLHSFSSKLNPDEAIKNVRGLGLVMFNHDLEGGVKKLSGLMGIDIQVKTIGVGVIKDSGLTKEQQNKLRDKLKDEYTFYNELLSEFYGV